jgi:hypothetical protein
LQVANGLNGKTKLKPQRTQRKEQDAGYRKTVISPQLTVDSKDNFRLYWA